jgi:hypothetical protein
MKTCADFSESHCYSQTQMLLVEKDFIVDSAVLVGFQRLLQTIVKKSAKNGQPQWLLETHSYGC